MQKIIRMLNTLQEQEVYHGDIKPANIMLTFTENDITPVFIDFGVSLYNKYEHDFENAPMWEPRDIYGCPHIPPELLELANPLRTSDLFSAVYMVKLVADFVRIDDMKYLAKRFLSTHWGSRQSHRYMIGKLEDLSMYHAPPALRPSYRTHRLPVSLQQAHQEPTTSAQWMNQLMPMQNNTFAREPTRLSAACEFYRMRHLESTGTYEQWH